MGRFWISFISWYTSRASYIIKIDCTRRYYFVMFVLSTAVNNIIFYLLCYLDDVLFLLDDTSKRVYIWPTSESQRPPPTDRLVLWHIYYDSWDSIHSHSVSFFIALLVAFFVFFGQLKWRVIVSHWIHCKSFCVAEGDRTLSISNAPRSITNNFYRSYRD